MLPEAPKIVAPLFRRGPRADTPDVRRTGFKAEYEALIDIALGLTDRGVARRRYLSRRGAQNRLHSLYTRLGVERSEECDEPGSTFSPRNRAVFEGHRVGRSL